MNARARRVTTSVVAIGALAVSGTAAAFWGEDHFVMNNAISQGAFLWVGYQVGPNPVSTLDDYLQNVLFVSGGLNAQTHGVDQDMDNGPWNETPDSAAASDANSLSYWNGEAGYWEDTFANSDQASVHGGLRVANHFHDPITNGGFIGMVNPALVCPIGHAAPGGVLGIQGLLGYGSSAALWAQTGDSVTAVNNGPNAWSFDAARTEYKNFLGLAYWSDDNPRGEIGLSNTLRALGQVEHLIEDNAVPDHTRDLGHPGYGLEEYVHDNSGVIPTDPASWVDDQLPLQKVEQQGFVAIWDQDVYTGAGSQPPTSGSLPGLSEYTNANFFAYNHFTRLGIGGFNLVDCVFTTIPNGTLVGWSSPPFFPAVRSFDFPLEQTLTGSLWSGFPASVPSPVSVNSSDSSIDCMAELNHGTPTTFTMSPARSTNAAVWGVDAPLLLPMAMGYATTPLRMMFPPIEARFEVAPGDPSKLVLHIFNHGGGNDGVTWKMDQITIAPISNPNTIYDDAFHITDERSFTIDPGGASIGANGDWTSTPYAPTIEDIWMLDHAPYVSVIIDAELGDNNTPLSFGAVIPSMFPDIVQGNVDMTPYASTDGPATFNNVGCTGQQCGSQKGMTGQLWNPVIQDVSFTINEILNTNDTLGKPLSGATMTSVQARSRLAGVALIARNANSPDLSHATVPTKSYLTFDSGPLVNQGGSGAVWVRDPNGADVADPQTLTFKAHIDFTEFGNKDVLAAALFDIVAWTQAGNQSVAAIHLWEPVGTQSAEAVAKSISTCAGDAPSGLALLTTSDCGGGASPPCSNGGTYTQGGSYVALTALPLPLATSNAEDTALAGELYAMNQWSCATLGGYTCQNWTAAPSGVVGQMSGGPVCPGPGTPPPLTTAGTFTRVWAEDQVIITKVLGAQLPNDTMTWQ